MSKDSSFQSAPLQSSSTEFLGMLGFGLYLGWMLIVSYCLFCEPLANTFALYRSFIQLWIFVGYAIGFVALGFLARLTRFNPFRPLVVTFEAFCGIILPLAALVPLEASPLVVGVLCGASFLAGLASAALTVSWLDICGRLNTRLYGRFTGISFLVGGIVFLAGAFTPKPGCALLALVSVLASLALLLRTTSIAEGNVCRAPLSSVKSDWRFRKEVEPSLFVFGIVFGMTFAWLFTEGETTVYIGLCAIVPGALCITLLSVFHVRVNITMVLRILLCLCVFACVFMPQSNSVGKLACSCLIVAAWVMFTALNYGFIVRKSVLIHDSPCFRKSPMRLFVPAAGFAMGWLIIYLATCLYGEGADEFIAIRLFVAVLLVVVFSLFFPSQEHLSMDDSPVSRSGLDEHEAYELRIRLIAQKYGLTPREREVIRYLARGRNAAYIQEKLVVSPHTVRSHMYNIYRKLGVHSQQELIDTVESLSLEAGDYA